jgi:hypothetical protein
LLGRLGLLPTSSSAAEFANTLIVSRNYFSVLGIAPLCGRTFEAETASELNTSPSVIISENYWQKRFARDPSMLGKAVRLNGATFTIIGITPHDFAGTSGTAPDFWLPLSLLPLVHPEDDWLLDRDNQCCRLFARLAPGVSIGQAQAEMTVLTDRLRATHDPRSELSKPSIVQIWPGTLFGRTLCWYSFRACPGIGKLTLRARLITQGELGSFADSKSQTRQRPHRRTGSRYTGAHDYGKLVDS